MQAPHLWFPCDAQCTLSHAIKPHSKPMWDVGGGLCFPVLKPSEKEHYILVNRKISPFQEWIEEMESHIQKVG